MPANEANYDDNEASVRATRDIVIDRKRSSRDPAEVMQSDTSLKCFSESDRELFYT